jgi:dihydrofolate reductase
MRKIIAHLFISLDGVAQLDTIHGLIMDLLPSDEEEDPAEKLAEEDAMILGRQTYQQWMPFWPTSTLPYASHINAVQKYVASRTLNSFPWGSHREAMPLEGDLADAVASLKRQPGKNIGVHGSPTLVGAMLQENLIDVLRLQIYPIIAGSGPRMFLDRGDPKQLVLVDSKVSSKGVATMIYKVNGNILEPSQ